jgi:hypothetical protein
MHLALPGVCNLPYGKCIAISYLVSRLIVTYKKGERLTSKITPVVPATRVAAGEIKEARCEMTADGLLSHLHIWGGGEEMRIYPRGAFCVCSYPTCAALRDKIPRAV